MRQWLPSPVLGSSTCLNISSVRKCSSIIGSSLFQIISRKYLLLLMIYFAICSLLFSDSSHLTISFIQSLPNGSFTLSLKLWTPSSRIITILLIMPLLSSWRCMVISLPSVRCVGPKESQWLLLLRMKASIKILSLISRSGWKLSSSTHLHGQLGLCFRISQDRCLLSTYRSRSKVPLMSSEPLLR